MSISPKMATLGSYRSEPANLPTLPSEILLEIIGCLEDNNRVKGHGDSNLNYVTSFDRRATVKSLMETCSSLRSIFVPYYWQNIEGCYYYRGWFDRDEPKLVETQKQEKERSKLILSQLETVTVRNPEVGKYVHTINISVFEHDVYATVTALKACMEGLCPRLRTLQIMGGFYSIKGTNFFEDAFEDVKYPNIHTLSLVPRVIPIIQALPNLRHLYWCSMFKKDYGPLRNALVAANSGSKLESFYGLTPAAILEYKDANPGWDVILANIRTLQIDLSQEHWYSFDDGVTIPDKVLAPLAKLNNLHALRLRFNDPKAPRLLRPLIHEQIVAWIDYAKQWVSRKNVPEGATRRLTVLREGQPIEEISLFA